MPGNAEVIELDSGMGDTKPCPPTLALNAIEATLAQKTKAYVQKYSAGVTICDDLVYSTWKILKSPVQPKEENVLVKAGIMPPNLAEIFPSPLHGKKNQQRLKNKRACVLTSISSRVVEQERLKREKQEKKIKRQVLRDKKKKEKEEAKSSREEERKRKKMAKESTVNASKKSQAHRTPLFVMQEEGISEGSCKWKATIFPPDTRHIVSLLIFWSNGHSYSRATTVPLRSRTCLHPRSMQAWWR